MTTLQPRIKPMPWVSWATATTEVNITMAQGWDDGLVLPEGWQHHRYKVEVSCYPYPPPNGDLFYLVNWWTLHQGRWPVCDRCGGENQTARCGDCQFASLLKVPIFLPHPGSPPTAGLVWGRWQRRRRKSASRSSKSLQGGRNRFLFCMGISGTSLLRKCFPIIFLFFAGTRLRRVLVWRKVLRGGL